MIFSLFTQIILLLLILGGAIAYIGNYMGRFIGKKRLTIFNLRPRHTAILITVFSGIMIAVSTAAVLLLISQDARTAFLGMEQLQKELKQKSSQLAEADKTLTGKLLQQIMLTQKLETAKKEINNLHSVKEKLGREIKFAREGEIVFKAGETIFLSLIQAGPERKKIESGLKKILSDAKVYTRASFSPENLEQTILRLSEQNGIYIAKLTAARNVLWGEEIPARFELSENKLIHKDGTQITTLDIPAGLSVQEIEGEIMKLLKKSHAAALEAGVLTNLSGSLGGIPYSQIFELAKKIRYYRKGVNLKTLADKDIYAIGPLTVKFKIHYQ